MSGFVHEAKETLSAIVRDRLSLTTDKADDETIDQELRAGVEIRGANLWVLIFAIFIASIGLNVNSTAVIIGAMLISPLMGPIMGVGYGLGIFDFHLIRRSLKNLAISAGIALATSSTYFLFSPLTSAQSELLSRTSPTIWDVLIALFGGLAGIVGATRKGKSNVIPGVAIATALMPPLCAAGYGLASRHWSFFFGAFYLFLINCVFIAFSSALVTQVFHVRANGIVDRKLAKRVRNYQILVVLLTTLPSVYLAVRLVRQEVFKSKATAFVDREIGSRQVHITQLDIDPKKRSIEVTLIGEILSPVQIARIDARLADAGLSRAQLKVHQADPEHLDISSLKAGILGDMYAQSQISLEKRDKLIQDLRDSLRNTAVEGEKLQKIPAELHVFYPQIREIWLSQAFRWDLDSGIQKQPTLVLNLGVEHHLSPSEIRKVEDWLRLRVKAEQVKLAVEPAAPKSSRRSAPR